MSCRNKTYISPTAVKEMWSTSDCVVQLANSEYFVKKTYLQKILDNLEFLGRDEVNEMIDEKVKPLDQKIDDVLNSVLSREVVDTAIGKYAKIDGETLTLNAENLK